ncbi:hypothetical protein ACFVH6_41450 [Spirillospora sp. NPDC127200]
MTRDQMDALRAAVDGLISSARAIAPDDDVAAYEFVTDLAAALRRLPELLAPVPALADAAALGRARQEELDRLLAELRDREAEIAERRAALDRLRPVATELRDRAETSARLDGELAELRRLEQLGAHLETLREQHALLAARKRELLEVAADEQRLGQAAQDLHRTITAELAGLREGVAQTAAEVARTEAEVAAARAKAKSDLADLTRLTAEMEELRAEAERRLPALKLYRQAEREIVEALAQGSLAKSTGLRLAREAMDEIDARLADLDVRLKSALRVHDETYARAREAISLTGADGS